MVGNYLKDLSIAAATTLSISYHFARKMTHNIPQYNLHEYIMRLRLMN